jgi:glycosyltransferase involved in cell wall biosynthesis
MVNQYAGSPRHGMEYRHYYLAREMMADGWIVVVVSGSYSHLFTQPPDVSRRYTTEEIDGVRYCWISVPRYSRSLSLGRVVNMLVFALRLARLDPGALPRPDAILVSSPSLFPIVTAARWARRWNARLVFEVRDIWPLTLTELGGARVIPLAAVMQWFEDYAYRVADAVVSVLPEAAGHMTSRGMDPRKFAYVPNGIALAPGEPATDAPPAVVKAVPPGTFTVGFVGTLGTANAVETLIDAARMLAREPVHIVVVGHGPERDRLLARAEGLSNVTFAGPIAKREVAPALRLFDACYVGFRRSPLYRFGVSPNKLYDYMAAGRPIVLATDAANRPVDEADCGRTIPPEDPLALATAIRDLAANPPAELDRLGRNAVAYVSRRHDYAVLARRLGAILLGDRA